MVIKAAMAKGSKRRENSPFYILQYAWRKVGYRLLLRRIHRPNRPPEG
jgi:hypothetical protein